LGAFFPAQAGEAPALADDGLLSSISLVDIAPNPDQPRRSFGEAALAELAESIKRNGVLAPIVVRPRAGDGPPYQIIAGERRWRAARIAGLDMIPALVRRAEDARAIELALIENVQRTDLNPIEEAAGYAQLMQHQSFTQDSLAQRLGKSRPAIANALRLLSLPDSIAALIRDGKISAGHGRALVGLPANVADVLARRAAGGKLTVRAVERAAAAHADGRTRQVKANAGTASAELADVESRLRFALATRVKLRGGRSGAIEIRYANEEELQRIVDRICPPEE